MEQLRRLAREEQRWLMDELDKADDIDLRSLKVAKAVSKRALLQHGLHGTAPPCYGASGRWPYGSHPPPSYGLPPPYGCH